MGKATVTSGVSIITCTNRPNFFDNILKNYSKQQYRKKELIIILNNDSMNLEQFQGKTQTYKNIKIYKLPEKISLGLCLNYGIIHTRFPLIAKFDDDDYYSPFYLKEQIKALRRTKSDVVGKHSCLVYLASKKKLIIRSPKKKNKYVELVQGGTILFRRRVLKKVSFLDRSVGEDVAFLRDCKKKGYKTYATSPFNYVYMRRKNKKSHTWRVGDEHYLKGSKVVAVTKKYRSIANREM